MNSSFIKRDAFLRMNFLYQAAHALLKETPNNDKLIRFYGHIFTSISKKNVLKVHPKVKRQICKKCSLLLVPGITSSVRIKKMKKNKQKVQKVKCLNCKATKVFVINPSHQLWIDHMAALKPIDNQTSKNSVDIASNNSKKKKNGQENMQ